MPKRRRTRISPRQDAESVGYLALFGGFLAAYLAAEAALSAQPHPLHWLAASAGAAVAGGLSYGLTLWRLTRRH